MAVKTWQEEFEDIVLSGPPQQVIAISGEYKSKYHTFGTKPILQRIWRKPKKKKDKIYFRNKNKNVSMTLYRVNRYF